MKFFRFLKNDKKKQRGVALIFALSILGLMVVLGLTFASLSFTEQTIARSGSEQIAARVMAKSAVQRVIAVLENNPTVTETEKIVSGGDPNNSNHFDFLWKMITHHGDVPGAGEMKNLIEKRIRNAENTPYWQYVIAPNKDGNNEIVGRFAYMAYQPVGLLDPYITAKNGNEAASPVDRYGMTMDEVDLKALIGVPVVGGSGALSAADIEELGKNNANNSVPSDIPTPAALFERFTAGTRTNLTLNPAYTPLRDRLTSAWFSVPRTPAQPDRFLYKNPSTNVDTFYHRFNLNRTPEQWKSLNLNNLIAADPATTLVVYDETAAKNENAGLAIPWFRKNDADTKQIAANFLAYFSPIPDDVTAPGFWDKSGREAAYTANMRTPYLNELAFKIKFNMAVLPPTIDGTENSPAYTKVYTIEITPEIDVYVELADLYSNSLNNISSLSFDINFLESLKASAPSSAIISYQNSDIAEGNGFKNIKFDVTSPASENINASATKSVFPVFTRTFSAAKPVIVTIRVPMTREKEGDNNYGPAKCAAVNFSEPLKDFVLQKISVVMSAKINGKSTVIPIDLANVANKTELPGLGEKKGRFDFSALDPFKLNIDTSGNIDAAQETQERVVVLRYRAIDSAANLKPEHWVESVPESFMKVSEALVTLGYNNYAELKLKSLLTIDTSNPDYNTLTVKINSSESKQFLVDKETDHDNINALTGYGAVLSTSYIRGRATGTVKIQSPWEIGFIHRGQPYQTLNIKRYNPSATEIAEYENGDANIFDYLKILQLESDNSVLDDNKIHTRGLVNLQKVSRQNGSGDDAGNLPAARAFFSNIDLGWKINLSNDLFTIPAAASNWNDNLEFAKKIVNALVSVVDKPDFILKSRAAILNPAHTELRQILTFDPAVNSSYSTKTDAEKEELIGRFIMLTTADTAKVSQFTDFLVVTAIAQRIQINTASQQPDKDWLRDGSFDLPNFSGNPSNKAEENARIEAGYGYRYVVGGSSGFWYFKNAPSGIHPSAGNLSAGTARLLKFYPGYDKILSTQKVIAWLRRNANGKWYIERLDYVD
ncbi:MAG: type II secretion system protein [Lentisphaeria bacterium]|nr:type II secretion system protein [Lentisphaeria bacterium]